MKITCVCGSILKLINQRHLSSIKHQEYIRKSTTTDKRTITCKNIGKDKTAKDLGNLATGKEETFNRILGLVTKYQDDKSKVDAFISKAENEYKLPASLLKQLKLAAGRDVEI